ncbi:hypothetical protein BDR05DRAFT_966169 [Suillus weaverae]|nr:hypothetical protein BDR05DRAFT_966169 [Suillus weaverae]
MESGPNNVRNEQHPRQNRDIMPTDATGSTLTASSSFEKQRHRITLGMDTFVLSM